MASSSRLMQQLFAGGVVLFAVICGMLAASCVAHQTCEYDNEVVYDYYTVCGTGVVYGQSYHLFAGWGLGGLVPEWDETNQTYYMRLTGSSDLGSSFTLLPVDSDDNGTIVRKNDTLRIALSSLDYALSWRAESETEWFLEQKLCSSDGCESDGASFVIRASDASVACPFIEGARCYAYILTSAPGDYSGGLKKYEEGGVVYITLSEEGSEGDLPLLLIIAGSELRTVVA